MPAVDQDLHSRLETPLAAGGIPLGQLQPWGRKTGGEREPRTAERRRRKTGLELKDHREKGQEKSQDAAVLSSGGVTDVPTCWFLRVPACPQAGDGSLSSLSDSDTWEVAESPQGSPPQHRGGRRDEMGAQRRSGEEQTG